MKVVENLIRIEKLNDLTHNYSYRMVKGQKSFSISGDNVIVQTYGIEIERQDICADGMVINIERDSICIISPQRHKVHNLLKMLYDNQVSPIHLLDVIGEYVDEYIIDFDNVSNETANGAQ